MDALREGVKSALMIAGPAPFLGAAVTVVALVIGGDLQQVAHTAALGFWSLAVVLPVMTLLLLAPADEETPEHLTRGRIAALVAGCSTVAGSIGGVLLFIVVSGILAPVIRRFSAVTYSTTLRAEIGWGAVLIVLAVCSVTGLIVAVALSRRPAASA